MTVNVNTSPPDFIKSTTCLWVAPSTFTLFLQRNQTSFYLKEEGIHIQMCVYVSLRVYIPWVADRFVSRCMKIRSAPIVRPLVLHRGHVARQHIFFFFFFSRYAGREGERRIIDKQWSAKRSVQRRGETLTSEVRKYNFLVPNFRREIRKRRETGEQPWRSFEFHA